MCCNILKNVMFIYLKKNKSHLENSRKDVLTAYLAWLKSCRIVLLTAFVNCKLKFSQTNHIKLSLTSLTNHMKMQLNASPHCPQLFGLFNDKYFESIINHLFGLAVTFGWLQFNSHASFYPQLIIKPNMPDSQHQNKGCSGSKYL